MFGTTKTERDAAFTEFMSAATPSLLRTAWLLTGSADAAHDLVQAALVKTYAAWSRVRRDEAARLLALLPDQQRRVIVLRYYNDLSEQAVAEILGLSVGGVKSAASRGLAALRAQLGTTATTSATSTSEGRD